MVFGSVPAAIAAPVLDSVESAEVSVPEAEDAEAVLAGETLPNGVPLYNETYGDLIYYDDFEGGEYFDTAKAGASATIGEKQLAYVTEGNWGSNVVDNPNGEGKAQKLTVANSYSGKYTGYLLTLKNVTLNLVDITLAFDVYFPEEATETFRIRIGDSFINVPSADYTGSGTWQTIYLPMTGMSSFAANQQLNYLCGVEPGTVYYIDNIKVYTKPMPLQYATKPAAIDNTLGSLIYFDNGKSEDFVGNDDFTVHGLGTVNGMGGYYAKNVYRDEAAGMVSPGIVIKTKSGTFEENGYNGKITFVTDVYAPDAYTFYPAGNVKITSSAWSWGSSWYAAGSLTAAANAYKTFSVNFNIAGKGASAIGFMKSSDSGVPYARSFAVYYLPNNYVKVTEGSTTKLVDLGEATTWTATAPTDTSFNAWKDADGRIYLKGDKVASGASLTAAVCSFEPVDDTYGTLVWLDDFNTEGSQSKATYINTAWDIALSSYNMSAKSFGTDGEHKYLKIQSYWYGGYKLTANNGTGVPGHYTLVVDYKYDEAINKDGNDAVVKDKAWMSFNEADLGGSGYFYPTKPAANTWGTMAKTITIESGSTFVDAMFRGGTTGQNVYYYIDEMKLYFLPLNYITVTEGTEKKIIDLQTATTYTLTAPSNTAYDVWADNSGRIYKPGETVAAGTALTAISYAKKPAEATEYGKLVYFYNGNTADTVNEIGAKHIGSGSTGVYDGFVVTYTTDCTALLGSCSSHGMAIVPEATAYTKNGTITLVVEQYNNMTNKEYVRYTALSNTQLGTYSEAWGDYYVDYSNTVKTFPGNWYTLKATANTANKMVGFFEREWVNHANLTRGFKSIAVYYIPEDYVKLVDGEILRYEDLNNVTEFTFPAITSEGKNAWSDGAGNAYLPGEKLAVADCKDKTFTATVVVFDEVSKLEASASAITTDNGTVTVKPVVRYTDGSYETDFSDVTYTVDTVNATVIRNSDDSITVKGQINGDVTITATIPEEIKEKLENPSDAWTLTVNISGQPERIVSSTFKVMMFGNSIRAHGAAPNMGWYGETRGMAASSIDKDYAHRFIYYMNEKFGEGAAELVKASTPDNFESLATKGIAYNAADYEGFINSFKSQIIEQQPDIITIQLGENGSGATKEKYASVMTQLIKGIQSVAPDAIIVMSSPFWSGDTNPLVLGTYMTAEECGIEVAPVNTLGQGAWDGSNPNMAFQAPWITEATTNGVKAHPGDEGMDKIAKMFFEKVNISLSGKELEYSLVPQSIEITNSSLEITDEEGTLALTANVLPAGTSQEVVWELVSDKAYNYATIAEDGVITAINNGTVKVRATSRFKSTVYVEADVVISGQADPFTVTFDGNAADATVPAPNEFAKKGFDLTNVAEFANRPTYKFLGWALTPDGEVVESLADATTDTTVYAQWELADSWNFERKGYLENFSSEYGFHEKVVNGFYTVTATGTTDTAAVKIISPELNLDSSEYSIFTLKMLNDNYASDTVAKFTIITDSGRYEFEKAVTTKNSTEYRFDLSEVTGTITGFEIMPTNIDCEIQIEEIKFLKNGVAEYAEMPALYDNDKGILVFFENGNPDDSYSNINATLVGSSGKTVVNGYYARDIADAEGAGFSGVAGVGLETTDKTTHFAYADGTDFVGNIRFYADMYSTVSTNLVFRRGIRPQNGWDEWSGVYTDWTQNRTAVQNEWTLMDVNIHANISFVGLIRNYYQPNGMYFRSAYAYFMPENYLKLVDGDKLTIIDLSGLSTVKLPAPKTGSYDGWTFGTDEYMAFEEVAVSDVLKKTLTAADVANVGTITYVGTDKDYVDVSSGDVQYNVKTDNYPVWDMSIDGTKRVCIGWSLTENDTTPIDSVTVTEAGITLYPVWNKTADAVEYELTIDGETAIELDNIDRTYTYEAVFSAAVYDETVKWSVSDKSVATIDENGVLTPKKDGNITVTAKADYYPGKTATLNVDITYKDGFTPVNVTFEGDVKALPEAFVIVPGRTFSLADSLNMTPKKSGVRFNGWILNGDTSKIYTGEVTAISEDMTFTALVNHDFNFATPQTDNRYYNHGTMSVSGDVLKLKANGGNNNDTYLEINGLTIPAAKYSAVEYYVELDYKLGEANKTFAVGDTAGELYFVVNGYKGPKEAKVASITEDGKYAVIVHDLSTESAWSGTITALRNDFVGGENYGSYGVRYIRLVEKPQSAETNVTISDITIPVTGYAPDTTATVAEDFAKIEEVYWTCSESDSFLATGRFNQNTAYTVNVTLSSNDSKKILNKNLTATINNETAQVTFNTDGNAVVSYTFTATDPFLAFTAEITGNSVIESTGRVNEYKFVVSNADVPDKTATWSIVEDTDAATIAADTGKLVAVKNGMVTVKAVSNYDSSVFATYTVVLQNIDEIYRTISFAPGTTDTVTGLPSGTVQVLQGVMGIDEVTTAQPERAGYVFLGWAEKENGNANDIIDKIVAYEDLTLYPVWGTGIRWDFNGTNEGFKDSNVQSTLTASDNYLIVKTTTGNDVRLLTPTINVSPERYSKLVIKFAVDKQGKTDVFYSPDGKSINASRKLTLEHTAEGLDNWQILTFDFSEVTAWNSATEITKLWIDIFDSTETTAYIDYIVLLENPAEQADDDDDKPYEPDPDRNVVEDVTAPGEIFPAGDGNPEDMGSVKLEISKEGTATFNFDKEYQMSFFDKVTSVEEGHEADSVLSYRLFSKNNGSVKSAEMLIDSIQLNADEKKYIVLRARHLGLERAGIRIYFTRAGETEYSKFRSVRKVLTNEYSTIVYDMSKNKYWDGKISSLRFVVDNNVEGTIDIDWIMITDTIPSESEQPNEAKDIFDVARSGNMTFTDVAKNAWYYNEVNQSYRRGFVNGKSETEYDPNAGVTVAEAITIAVRLNSIYNGVEAPEAAKEGNWYDTFVQAATDAKIITGGQFKNFDVPATRREVAMIMAKAVPTNYLEAINVFNSVPDVVPGSKGSSEVLKLYNAGVVIGSDAQFNFYPDSNVTRAELAAIVNRLALPGARKRAYTEDERIANSLRFEGQRLTSCSLWNCSTNSLVLDKDGYAGTTSAGTDPIALLHTVTGTFDGRDVARIKIGIKWDPNEVELTPNLYYATASANSFSGSRVCAGVTGEQDANGVAEVVFDVKKQSAFADTITQLRLDPFEVTGKSFAIAYIIIE